MNAELPNNNYPRTVQDLVNHYQNGCLNLSLGFQRQSVWRIKDRQNLIDSIIRNYALPAISLYKRTVKEKSFMM